MNLTDVTISHAWLVDVEIDAFMDTVVVNGVDVTAFVNEHDRWCPLRLVLSAADPESMRSGWAALREAWAATRARARRLPDEDLHVSVDGEWSFVQTLRHLVPRNPRSEALFRSASSSFHPVMPMAFR